MRGFRFRSVLYSEWCAQICLAPSQNSNVWRPNSHVWTHFKPIFSLRVHGWIQTTVSQLAGVRECRGKRQLSFLLFIYWCSEDLNKQFSSSRNRFLRQTPTSQDRFAASAATLARFVHVGIFWLADESNTKFARRIACCAWSAVKWITCQV